MSNPYCVYILTNKENRVLYIGVTNNLERRLYEHTEKSSEGFSKQYNLNKLVYFEPTDHIDGAILREKQLKGWSRQKKIDLIQKANPEWQDLRIELGF